LREIAGLALVLGLAVSACDQGNASNDGCRVDSDCANAHCVAGACVSFRNPLDATVPDLALDGGTNSGG
jgi:hypothetical protein